MEMSHEEGPGCSICLTWYEYAGAVQVGLLRFSISMAQDRKDNEYDGEISWLKRLEVDVIGACAERALAKILKRYWDGSVNTFHGVPDLGDMEVRGTALDNGSLIIREKDEDERFFNLVTGAPPRMTWRGWIKAGDAKREEWVRNPNGLKPAWFVPQEALYIPPKYLDGGA